MKKKLCEKINNTTVEIQANGSIGTYARKVNKEIHRKTVCHKDTAVLRNLFCILIKAALSADCLNLRYSLYSVQY